MIILILILIAVVLAIQFFIATEFYNVANEKGYDSKKYLWIPFLFGIVGYLLVIALPNKKNTEGTIIYNNVEKVDKKPSGDEWKCPRCGKINANYVGSCGCGQTKPR